MDARRTQGMDSRLRGNDVGGCGNDVEGVGTSLKVRGVRYRYAAWIPGGHPVLRYHNMHYDDDFYHHRVFDPHTGRRILSERLARYQFPTLSEVIDEIEVVTRSLESPAA